MITPFCGERLAGSRCPRPHQLPRPQPTHELLTSTGHCGISVVHSANYRRDPMLCQSQPPDPRREHVLDVNTSA